MFIISLSIGNISILLLFLEVFVVDWIVLLILIYCLFYNVLKY